MSTHNAEANAPPKAVAGRNKVTTEIEQLVMRPPQNMKKAVEFLQHYMATYDQQQGYENYSVETFVNDVLYGLGEAIDPEGHQYAQGFRVFKEKLKAYLSA